jgi:hypothetical protein
MPLDDGRLLGFPGPPNSEFFSIYNMSGDYLGSPRVALPGPELVPLSARLELLNGTSRCARLDGGGFAMTYHLASIIQLYDRDGAFVRNAAVPVRSEEHFEPNPRSGKITFQRGIPHYSACAYSRDHLFAVYWGTSFTDEEPEGQTIHQFDLTGNFVRTLHVDAKFSYIAGRTVVSCPPPSLT